MQLQSTQTRLQNQLLSSMRIDAWQRLRPSLELCKLPLGKVLYESGEPIHHVYFPIDSIVSLLDVTAEGESVEISLVGNEGMLGVRREGVTQAAGKLQRMGVIEYFRGHIHVLDREQLEESSCECYREIKTETDKLNFVHLQPLPALPFATVRRVQAATNH